MKYFEEMVKLVGRQGIMKSVSGVYKNTEINIDDFYKAADECEIFLFLPEGKDSNHTYIDHKASEHSTTLSAPFKTFSIEMEGLYLSYVTDDLKTPLTKQGCVSCLMVSELDDNRYEYWYLISITPNDWVVGYSIDGGDEMAEWSRVLVKLYLDRLSAGVDGVLNVNKRINIKNPKNPKKKKTFIKDKIFIVAKKDYSKSLVGKSRNIEWNHQWSVRGTWVTLSDSTKIGKDRSGKYCIHGKTWRIAHKKGLKGGVLIKKERVVL